MFTEVRPQLFGIVYRMLGSTAEAEDVLQDAWIRWHTTDRSVVRNPHAFLTTTTTRLAINVLRSAHTRRETCAGPALPEPVDTGHDPALGAEHSEALDVAVLVLLERLTPTERAAYVLREAFEYAYADIAEIVQLSQAAARQLVSRARKHLASGRRSAVLASKRRALHEAFVAAARSGELARLERLFAQDVVERADGAGRADADVERPAVRVPAVRVPAVRIPAVRIPAVRTPAVRTPAVRTPAVRIAAERTPAVRTPAARTPAVQTPAVQTPAAQTPAVRIPAASAPAASTPAASGATVSAPDVGTVTVRTPAVSSPTVRTPDVRPPAVPPPVPRAPAEPAPVVGRWRVARLAQVFALPFWADVAVGALG
ncbi:sigma-70 family RNA polymerase sigma factor [Promicromonospora sukumoe]|uniref:sigma-70 family RNA polymerase sigma factor n=1 Tax=Promicromonospora sukumoe TaxID=88382 RepID=UPI001E2F03B6|nr:sigma-70 family RNA polymerase sigma factor [Promicromonospora sukumoe]